MGRPNFRVHGKSMELMAGNQDGIGWDGMAGSITGRHPRNFFYTRHYTYSNISFTKQAFWHTHGNGVFRLGMDFNASGRF